MAETLYATFADSGLAQKAAGALLDYGVRAEDISVVAKDTDNRFDTDRDYAKPSAVYHDKAVADDEGRVRDTGDSVASGTSSAGNRAAQAGDRAAGAVAGAVGATGTAANFEAAADARRDRADYEADRARADMAGATNAGMKADRVTDPGYAAEGGAVYTTGAVPADTAADYDTDVNTRYTGGAVTYDSDYDRKTDRPTAGELDDSAKSGISTTTPADAGAGAAKGAGIGLGVGVVAALASLFVPGIGLVVGGGALASAIAGAAGATVAGAVAGGVHGYLKDQGMPEQIAARFNEAYERGGAILAVNTPSGNVDRATIESILGKYGASNVGVYGASVP